MTTTPTKPPAAGAPAQRKAQHRKQNPGTPAVGLLTPVARKIGETPGNLQARAAAFKRRHGPGK